jgi:hypothetical protein
MTGIARQLTGLPYLGSFTWANRPTAASHTGKTFFCSDVGGGVMLYSNGTVWRSLSNSPIVIVQAGKGWLVPSLAAANAATYSQTGTTVTVTSTGHGIPATTYNGLDVYLTIGSGLAATGWYSNFTYVNANSFTCTYSVSQSTSGVVNTNIAAVTVSEVTTTLPGGLLGRNGKLRVDSIFNGLSSGNNKTNFVKLDSAVMQPLVATTNSFDSRGTRFWNKNDEAKNVSTMQLGYVGANTALTNSTVNTAIDNTLSVTLQCAAASEFTALLGISVEVMPG